MFERGEGEVVGYVVQLSESQFIIALKRMHLQIWEDGAIVFI